MSTPTYTLAAAAAALAALAEDADTAADAATEAAHGCPAHQLGREYRAVDAATAHALAAKIAARAAKLAAELAPLAEATGDTTAADLAAWQALTARGMTP